MDDHFEAPSLAFLPSPSWLCIAELLSYNMSNINLLSAKELWTKCLFFVNSEHYAYEHNCPFCFSYFVANMRNKRLSQPLLNYYYVTIVRLRFAINFKVLKDTPYNCRFELLYCLCRACFSIFCLLPCDCTTQ